MGNKKKNILITVLSPYRKGIEKTRYEYKDYLSVEGEQTNDAPCRLLVEKVVEDTLMLTAKKTTREEAIKEIFNEKKQEISDEFCVSENALKTCEFGHFPFDKVVILATKDVLVYKINGEKYLISRFIDILNGMMPKNECKLSEKDVFIIPIDYKYKNKNENNYEYEYENILKKLEEVENIEKDENFKNNFDELNVEYDYKGEVRRTEYIFNIFTKFITSNENNVSFYVDFTGGFRDINYLMSAIIQYMEALNVSCERIVYSDLPNKRIHTLKYIYDINGLIIGMQEFITTGNARKLSQFKETHHSIEKFENLFKYIQEFSDAMSLCQVNKIDESLKKLSEEIKKLEKGQTSEGLTENDITDVKATDGRVIFYPSMIISMFPLMRKLIPESTEEVDYPRLIKWCVNNNMIQQAITLYEAKMPGVFLKDDFVSKKIFGKRANDVTEGDWREVDAGMNSREKEAFYGRLFRCYSTSPIEATLAGIIEKLKDEYENVENDDNKRLTIENIIDNIIENDQDEWIKGTLKEIKYYIKFVFKQNGDRNEKIKYGYGRLHNNRPGNISNANSLNTFIEHIKIKKFIMMNDAKRVYLRKKEIKSINNTQRFRKGGNNDIISEYIGLCTNNNRRDNSFDEKIKALENLREKIDANPNEDEIKLLQIKLLHRMKYYLAINTIRNMINHANGESNVNTDNLREMLGEEYGVFDEMTVENIKRIIENGLSIE